MISFGKHLNMDFAYLPLALLLTLTCCMGDVTETPFKFDVKIEPTQNPLQIAYGESRLLSCLTAPGPNSTLPSGETPVYEWAKDGEAITNKDSSKGMFIEESLNRYTLRIPKAIEETAGKYKCTVALSGVSGFAEMTVEVFQPLKVDAERDQFGILGQSGDIMCKASGQPTPTVVWKDKLFKVITNSKKYIIKQDRLTVNDLEFSDNGRYICDVIIYASGDAEAVPIEYEVVELPVIDLAPSIEPTNPKVGNEAKIKCTATGTPTPTYSFKKGETVMPDSQVDTTNGILTIPSLKREDEADYTCIATNRGGSAQKSNKLDVKIPPVIMDIANVPEAAEDSDLSVTCIAEGDPKPTMVWRKVGMESDYNDGVQDEGPTIEKIDNSLDDSEVKRVELKMIFDQVKAQDAGEYVCRALNHVGNASKQVTIGVQYKPFFKPVENDIFYGWKGHRANLTCQASGNPLATLEWKRKSADNPDVLEPIVSSNTYTIADLRLDKETKLSTRTLWVFSNEDDPAVYGEYICEAKNIRKTVTKSITLKKATSPGQPKVSVLSVLSTTMTIAIEKPDNNGGREVTAYAYSYNSDGETSDVKQYTAVATQGRITVELKDLKPSTTYSIKVSATSDVGSGSAMTITGTTEAMSAPVRLIISSPKFSSDTESYTLEWKEPNDGGSPISKFSIKYKKVETEKDADGNLRVVKDIDAGFTTKDIPNSRTLSITIYELDKDSSYELHIIAINEIGDSPETVTIFRTAKGAGNLHGTATRSLNAGLLPVLLVLLAACFSAPW